MKTKIFLILLSFLAVAPTAFALEQVDSEYMLTHPQELNGKEVIYIGEAVGDVMHRTDGYAWVNINDGKNAVGIWIPAAFADRITIIGRYHTNGDIISVTGVFHRACPQHGGDMDIHASDLRVLRKGTVREEKLNTIRILSALVLLPAALILGGIVVLRRY